MIFLTQQNIRTSKNSPVIIILNYSFLLLLLLSFYAQHVFAFSLYEKDYDSTKEEYHFSSSIYQGVFSLREEYPAKQVCLAVEMDLEEDEDGLHTSGAFQPIKSVHLSSFEFLYKGLIRTKLQRLMSGSDEQPVEHLFVLHHSWKEYINQG